MSLNAAALRLMAEKGLSIDDAVEIAEAMEVRKDSTAAERQRRHRAKKAGERDNVTRDVTRDTPPNEDNSNPPGVSHDEAAPHQRAALQPISEAVGIWNESAVMAGWPTASSVSETRRRSLNARLRENGLEGWRAAIARARASPYLGRDPPAWFTFNWIIKPENFLKLIEGNYDRNRSDNAAPSGWGQARSLVRLSGVGQPP